MPTIPGIPGVHQIEGERPRAGGRAAGDVSRGLFIGPALRGADDRPVELDPANLSLQIGEPYGGSHIFRSVSGFYAEGGASAIFMRATDATAASATADIDEADGDAVVKLTADGPGVWGNSLKHRCADGASGRKKITVLEGTTVRAVVEAASQVELVQRLAKAGVGVFRAEAGPGAWPPANTTVDVAFAGGVAADSAVTDADVIAALDQVPVDIGPCSVAAPGYTSLAVHEALLDHARARGRFAWLDMPDIADKATLVTQLQALRAYAEEKPGRHGFALVGWEVVPIGGSLTTSVPPSGLVAGRQARADATDEQRQARIAAGPAYPSHVSIGVTRKFSDADWEALVAAGGNLVRQEPEGVCLMGSHTMVDGEQWPQYLFGAGARVRMAIVDQARSALRQSLFKALDGGGVQLEAFRGIVENVCKQYLAIGGLFDENGDGGYSVTIVSTLAEIRQGRVRVRLGLRTSPSVDQIVLEFTAVAIGDRF